VRALGHTRFADYCNIAASKRFRRSARRLAIVDARISDCFAGSSISAVSVAADGKQACCSAVGSISNANAVEKVSTVFASCAQPTFSITKSAVVVIFALSSSGGDSSDSSDGNGRFGHSCHAGSSVQFRARAAQNGARTFEKHCAKWILTIRTRKFWIMAERWILGSVAFYCTRLAQDGAGFQDRLAQDSWAGSSGELAHCRAVLPADLWVDFTVTRFKSRCARGSGRS